jgi:hypothetical protein
MLTGWALVQQGDPQTSLPLVRQAIDDQRERNIRMFELLFPGRVRGMSLQFCAVIHSKGEP